MSNTTTVKFGRGSKIHLIRGDSTQTFCGRWGNAHSYGIVDAAKATCLSCLDTVAASPGINRSTPWNTETITASGGAA